MNSGLRNIGLKMYSPKPGMKVLDIGCGTGAHLRLYQKEECDIYGIDLSSAMIGEARKKLGPEAALVFGSATAMNFEDKFFDLILCSTVLHEMDPPVRLEVLSEAKRVLKNNGRILVIDFHPGPLKGFRGLYSKLIISLSERLAGRVHHRNYRQFMKMGGMPALIKSAGFDLDAQKIVSGGNFGLFLLKH